MEDGEKKEDIHDEKNEEMKCPKQIVVRYKAIMVMKLEMRMT